MRILISALIVVITSSVVSGEAPTFDLMTIEHVNSKGRIQDQPTSVPVITEILASGPDAIPVLIDLVGSERRYGKPPFDYWPMMHEGDMALAILSDLFLDPTWKATTLPESCWDNLLGRSDPNASAWELLEHYIEKHGRDDLARKWDSMWAEVESKIVWDEKGKFYRVQNKELVQCQ